MPIDFLNAPRLQALQSQAESTQSEDDKRKFLIMLTKAIIDAINEKTIDSIDGGIDINNLDSITASLRNELSRANKPLTEILTKLNLTTEQQTKVIKDIESKAISDFNTQYQTVIVKRIKDKVEVTNLDQIVYPSEYKITNLSDLEKYFQNISDKISALNLSVTLPAPQVTVEPAPVHIPETILNIPPVDLEPLISSLNENLKLLRTNNKSHPLAVRLTDGGDWIKQLVTIQKETQKAVTAFAGGSNQVRILDANMNVINPGALSIPSGIGDGSKNVTTAGTRVQLSATSISCRYVIVVGLVTNTDTIWVGGLTVAASRGRPLVAIQSEKIDIDNVNKIWIDSVVSGEGVSFAYVT